MCYHLSTLFKGRPRGEDVPAGRREKVPAAKERRDERGRAQQGQFRIGRSYEGSAEPGHWTATSGWGFEIRCTFFMLLCNTSIICTNTFNDPLQSKMMC